MKTCASFRRQASRTRREDRGWTTCHRASGGGSKYVVDGKIENLSGKKVILEKLSLQQITAIDSATLDKDGKFKLSNYADKGFYRLRVDSYAWILLLENSNFKFTSDSKDPIGYTVAGTDSSTELLEAER